MLQASPRRRPGDGHLGTTRCTTTKSPSSKPVATPSTSAHGSSERTTQAEYSTAASTLRSPIAGTSRVVPPTIRPWQDALERRRQAWAVGFGREKAASNRKSPRRGEGLKRPRVSPRGPWLAIPESRQEPSDQRRNGHERVHGHVPTGDRGYSRPSASAHRGAVLRVQSPAEPWHASRSDLWSAARWPSFSPPAFPVRRRRAGAGGQPRPYGEHALPRRVGAPPGIRTQNLRIKSGILAVFDSLAASGNVL